LKDKTEQIIKAALDVFTKKGFQTATTQEIAKEAQVAEITLYRKFSTKQNLFITVVKTVIEKQFNSYVKKLAKEEDTEEFLRQIISNRLEVLSKNSKLVKMLISESLMGNLEEEINLPTIIFSGLKNALDIHFDRVNKKVDTDFCARQLAGIFLSYIILPNEQPFHELDVSSKEKLVNKYVKSIVI
jgi:AcrR family transcriptional regulator